MDDTPTEKQPTGLPSQEGLTQEDGEKKDDLNVVLDEVKREEQKELLAELGEEKYKKIVEGVKESLKVNILSEINKGTGREYKDLDGIIKSIKEGSKHYQKARDIENAIEEALVEETSTDTNGTNDELTTEQEQTSAIKQPNEVNDNNVIDLFEIQADQMELSDKNFSFVKKAVLEVSKKFNASPKDVYNGEGDFALYDFRNRAKLLSAQQVNKVMPTSSGATNTGSRRLSHEQLLNSIPSMTAEQLKKAINRVKA